MARSIKKGPYVFERLLKRVRALNEPFFENATTDGVVLFPSAFGITTGSPPSITATHEFVVPKSIPIIFPITF